MEYLTKVQRPQDELFCGMYYAYYDPQIKETSEMSPPPPALTFMPEVTIQCDSSIREKVFQGWVGVCNVHSYTTPPPPPPLRIQPLSGRISAVTQLHSEAYVQSTLPTPSTQSTSTSEEWPQDTSTAEGGEGSKREDSGQTEGGENVASTAGHTVVPGGVFAGVGEFSSTLNPQAGSAGAQMKDLKMKYAKDAMLR